MSDTYVDAENWDEDFDFNRPQANEQTNAPRTPPRSAKKAVRMHWDEPGPSTLSRRPAPPAENWDEDFVDNSGSPLHGRTQPSRSQDTENWDDDFEEEQDGLSPQKKGVPRETSWNSSDEEDDYGFAGQEEDRTVTSRARTLPLKIPGSTPPPPVPPLPSPFPRSPTASVFSMPVSSAGGRDSTSLSYASTAHIPLRPTHSSGSSQARLALLPPSPPIHRERRRLRKKSRPPRPLEDNIYELEDRAEPTAPSTPERSPAIAPTALQDDAAQDPRPSTSAPTTKSPLLSRIGSVGKRWSAGRRKRASTGPSEVALHESPREQPASGRSSMEQRSRPVSLVAAGAQSSSKSGAGGWFFRGGGGSAGPGAPPAQPAALVHERSIEKLLALIPGATEQELAEWAGVGAGQRFGASTSLPQDVPALTGEPQDVFGAPRRPMSMQVPGSRSSSTRSKKPPLPRLASYGQHVGKRPSTAGSSRSSSRHGAPSVSVEDVRYTRGATDEEPEQAPRTPSKHAKAHKDDEPSGKRIFGIRRISLAGSTPKRSKQQERGQPATAISTEKLADTQDEQTPRPPSRVMRSSFDALLPPIELQPPSPPRTIPTSPSAPPAIESMLRPKPSLEPSRSHPALSAKSSPVSLDRTSSDAVRSPLPSPGRPGASTSPAQSASLGRATQLPKEHDANGSSPVPRRSSLGDLKIPPRISQAQMGLRRDLWMVREFAASVEQLKQLQARYTDVVSEVQAAIINAQTPSPRTVSPTMFSLPKPISRSRSNTHPLQVSTLEQHQPLSANFQSIDAKYRIAWECAELLIDLGGGTTVATSTPGFPSSQSMPVAPATQASATSPIDGRKSRERAVTLGGDDPKPVLPLSPTTHLAESPTQWRASTGRHELSQRQLQLLREMLNNPDTSATMALGSPIPEEEKVNRGWHWGDPMSSTVTLPTEDLEHGSSASDQPGKKRRSSRLGMRALRDMLKSLKKASTEHSQAAPLSPLVPQSAVSISASTDSSAGVGQEKQEKQRSLAQRRRAKTSTGPDSVRSARQRDGYPDTPSGLPSSLTHRSSPRRPSLASIFRLGQKSKTVSSAGPQASRENLGHSSPGEPLRSASEASTGEDDWDRVESSSDLTHAAQNWGSSDGSATVRGRSWKNGRSPYMLQQARTPDARRMASASRSSIWSSGPGNGSTAQIDELPSTTQVYQRTTKLSDVQERPDKASSRPAKNGSAREVDPKLAMTPENIGPLLEHAREVHTRCAACIAELRALLSETSL
ncbi:hypothetical protein CERSUDRAFT_96332 [Gelatoporia subvermispora B]|uniref:Uncharacterized protein n=1 Tax=Ceriporiopsis subvermispora (strain B) TaxID=914234 RepID=M2RBE3_CERS8|nr:hypothetical protein CERSUDRAFT_96332 [Gelatoporia subvermispora B]